MLHNPKFTGEEIGVFESHFVTPIPYSKHSMNKDDIEAVLECLRTGPITQGNIVTDLENAISERVGCHGAVVSNSATSSLHLACLALDVKRGDIVWTTANSFVSSANAALMTGATIDFVDIEIENGNLCPVALDTKLQDARQKNQLPKVLIVVHFSGRPCKMQKIAKVCKKYEIKIIEDAAHALGAILNNKHIGFCEYSEITVFSLHPAKIITSAEGGLATSQNPALIEKMRLLSSHGIIRGVDMEEPWKYDMINLGFNYRMSELHAALGMSQLERLNEFLKKRKEIVLFYIEKLKGLPLKIPPYSSDSAWHLFVCHAENSRSRTELFNFLSDKQINVGIHYRPIYQNSYFQESGFKETYLPNAEKYYSSSLSLPLYTDITNDELKYIISKLYEFYGVKYD